MFILSLSFISNEGQAGGRRSRRYYRGGGNSTQNYQQAAPSGRYHGTQDYQTEAETQLIENENGSQVDRRYDVRRDFEVYKDGRSIQTGRISYQGGDQSRLDGANFNRLADQNEQKAKALQNLAGTAADLESLFTILKDQVNSGTLRAARGELAFLDQVMVETRNLIAANADAERARDASSLAAARRDAQVAGANILNIARRGYQQGFLSQSTYLACEQKLRGPVEMLR